MPQLPKISTTYGAPMGRKNQRLDKAPGSIRLFKVNLDSGGYDDGGAYWGTSLGDSLYCAMDEEGSMCFVRETSRLRAAIALDVPNTALKNRIKSYIGYCYALLRKDAPQIPGVYSGHIYGLLQDSGVKL